MFHFIAQLSRCTRNFKIFCLNQNNFTIFNIQSECIYISKIPTIELTKIVLPYATKPFFNSFITTVS